MTGESVGIEDKSDGGGRVGRGAIGEWKGGNAVGTGGVRGIRVGGGLVGLIAGGGGFRGEFFEKPGGVAVALLEFCHALVPSETGRALGQAVEFAQGRPEGSRAAELGGTEVGLEFILARIGGDEFGGDTGAGIGAGQTNRAGGEGFFGTAEILLPGGKLVGEVGDACEASSEPGAETATHEAGVGHFVGEDGLDFRFGEAGQQIVTDAEARGL